VGLLAHRGSFKTTSIIIIGCIWWLLFHPNDRIAIIRKRYTDAAECLYTIRNIFSIPVLIELFRYAHNGTEPKLKIKRDSKLQFNFKQTQTPEGNIDAYGIDTGITGKHYDLIICDDFVTIKDRVSKADRERTKLIIQEIITNIIDPGKFVKFIGTPWHKDDCWNFLHNAGVIPIKYDYRQTGILTENEITEKRKTITPSLFAANYELKHIASEDALFTNPNFKRWEFKRTGIFGHLDAKYSGEHTNGLTFFRKKHDGRIQGVGFCFPDHVKNKYDFIVEKWKKYFCGTFLLEDNADKGFVADELKKRGIPVQTYHEKENKHVKITNYLYKYWTKIDWDQDTDPEYLNQILDYIEGQEPDDCPDSAASLLREKFHKKNYINLYK
jgi:hypothetical protein